MFLTQVLKTSVKNLLSLFLKRLQRSEFLDAAEKETEAATSTFSQTRFNYTNNPRLGFSLKDNTWTLLLYILIFTEHLRHRYLLQFGIIQHILDSQTGLGDGDSLLAYQVKLK